MQTLTANVPTVAEQISGIRDKYPKSIALSYGNCQLSYEELDRAAARFAGYLAQLGVVPGGTVAICMERSFDWIVAALGIMHAGAAYVPLDSAWPDSRLRFAVGDSGATILVARPALLDRLQVEARGVDPCRDAAAIAAVPELLRRPIQPDSLAYVIYTSGTTGVPKGVEITHANLAHLIRWHRDTFTLTRQDRASHIAGLGFDAAVWEIWPSLSAGATVCLVDDVVRLSPGLLQKWMIHERVTIGFVPTVHAAPMTAMEWPSPSALRFLLTGGDVLHHAPAVHLPFEVVNNYGPTECTVVATSSVVKPGSHGAPPIGRPITGTTIYLLNENGEQVPDGTTGEIYIGGNGVGRGYRNLQESTKRSFLPDPFAGSSSARMYRTSDRGVRRPDGEIEFRGRLDRQTKIRGQRVELEEISSILTLHPGIDFATVATTISQAGEKQLVAYVLPKENARVPTAQELQKHLLCSLPDYMIPPIFVRLHALPLSPSGKIDLTNLAHLTDAQLLEPVAPKAFGTPIEDKLLALIRALLNNDAVRREDNLFLAGGHSLMCVQLLLSLRKTFGVELTVRQLFEAPTVDRLALLVESTLEESRHALLWEDLLGRKRVGVDDNFFDLGGDPVLVATLQRRIATDFGLYIPISELIQNPTVRQHVLLTLSERRRSALPPGVIALQPNGTRNSIFWVGYACVQDLAKVIGDDQPLLCVDFTAEDAASSGDALTLESIAACLLRKILAAQSKGPYTLGGYCLGGIIAYEISSQLRAAGHEVGLLVLLDAPNPAYTDSCGSLTGKLNYVRYALGRAARLGPRTSFAYLRERLFKRFAHMEKTKPASSEMSADEEKMEAAALAYRPKMYGGKVLLLMASERPPHVNFLPGWQAVVPRGLHAEYIDAHHKDLVKGKNIQSVADAILTQLKSTHDDNVLPFDAVLPGSTSSGANGKPD